MHVEIDSNHAEGMAVTITMEEWMRRMKDMSRMGGCGANELYGTYANTYKVSVNANHKLGK
jgi:molecular chaperone HtpG